MTHRPAHLTQTGLARITVEAVDESTALTIAYRLIARSNMSGPSEPYRVPGEEGVRVAMYGDGIPLPAPDDAG